MHYILLISLTVYIFLDYLCIVNIENYNFNFNWILCLSWNFRIRVIGIFI